MPWFVVSLETFLHPDELLTIKSICAITAARIKSVVDINPLDFTYTVVPDSIYGGLELELGIINACLPLLRHLFRNIFGSSSDLDSVLAKETQIDR